MNYEMVRLEYLLIDICTEFYDFITQWKDEETTIYNH